MELHQSSCSYQEPVSLSKLTRHYKNGARGEIRTHGAFRQKLMKLPVLATYLLLHKADIVAFTTFQFGWTQTYYCYEATIIAI